MTNAKSMSTTEAMTSTNVMSNTEAKEAIHFLTEQACLNIWIMGWTLTDKNFNDFEEAVTYLAKDEPELMQRFKEYTNTAMSDEAHNREYDANNYGGKAPDVHREITNLTALANSSDIPEKAKDVLNRVICYITDFHDADEALIHDAGETAATSDKNKRSTIEKAIYFLTEQAHCLIQARGKDNEHFKICEKAVRYLTKGDPELLQPFKERTSDVKHDPDADYDTEQYDGKEADMLVAVEYLANLANDPGTPADKAGILKQGADLIAGFYGKEGVLSDAS
jgi:NTP pyrophosphatase (non-canonical NTP hydrolase)